MPERFKVVCTMQGAIQVLSFTFLPLLRELSILYSVFYSAAALLAMQSAVLATTISSVCSSVTRWYPIQTNEDRITPFSL